MHQARCGLIVAGLLLLHPAPASAAVPLIEVQEIQAPGAGLTRPLLRALGQYLAAVVLTEGKIRVALSGSSAAARAKRLLRARILRFGRRCAVTGEIIERSTKISELAAVANARCKPEALSAAIRQVGKRLGSVKIAPPRKIAKGWIIDPFLDDPYKRRRRKKLGVSLQPYGLPPAPKPAKPAKPAPKLVDPYSSPGTMRF